MSATLVRGAMLAAALWAPARPCAAQLFANPVYFSPSHGTGFSLHGDYGRNIDRFDRNDINFVGGRAILGLGPLSIMGGAGAAFDSEDTEATFGGAVALNILDLPLVPVSVNVQGGVGSLSSGGITELDVPIGVGVAINVPAPILDVEPWIAPRIHIMRLSNGMSLTEFGYGVSAGLNLTIPTGLGFHVAVDYVKVSDFDIDTVTLGAGLHYRITIPGLVPGGLVK